MSDLAETSRVFMESWSSSPEADLEGKDNALRKLEALTGQLTAPLPIDRAAVVEHDLSLLEDYARSAGLFRPEEHLELRLARSRSLASRRGAGADRARTGPGRGKKVVGSPTSFRALLAEIGLKPDAAVEAQRVACLPFKDFEKFCNGARRSGDVPTFDELIRYARPYWYQASRRAKHEAIRDRAVMNRSVVGPFPLIYADPPWRFDVYGEKGLERTPDQHYETLTDEEIIAFKVAGKSVREIAADAAALLLWCTSSNVHRALDVMDAWGFEFKTSAVLGSRTSRDLASCSATSTRCCCTGPRARCPDRNGSRRWCSATPWGSTAPSRPKSGRRSSACTPTSTRARGF